MSPVNSSTKKQPPRPSPKRSQGPAAKRPQAATGSVAGPRGGTVEVVDPRWLARALAICFAAALVCAWLTACLLFYQGEWQLVLHPVHGIDRTPASLGMAFEPVRFDAAETGQPRLTGWWVPAQNTSGQGQALGFATAPRYAGFTVLYLHGGSGSLSTTVPQLERLHRAGINVFAIDYRGFGASDLSEHPTEARMAQDAAAGLDYLTATRHISAQRIIIDGEGLGASLAANLALRRPGVAAVILDNPDPDVTATAAAGSSRLIPVRMLFRERFVIAGALATLAAPKLLIAGGADATGGEDKVPAVQKLFRGAASPSLTVTLPPVNDEAEYRTALTRFLDEYL
jgi:pimeloyl-ACP methyl ester carboxylesterase